MLLKTKHVDDLNLNFILTLRASLAISPFAASCRHRHNLFFLFNFGKDPSYLEGDVQERVCFLLNFLQQNIICVPAFKKL